MPFILNRLLLFYSSQVRIVTGQEVTGTTWNKWNFIWTQGYCEAGSQGGCGVSVSGGIQNLTGYSPGQLALSDHAIHRGWTWWSRFPPQLFWDSVKSKSGGNQQKTKAISRIPSHIQEQLGICTQLKRLRMIMLIRWLWDRYNEHLIKTKYTHSLSLEIIHYFVRLFLHLTHTKTPKIYDYL